jgi:hypothetical protein
MTLSNEGVLKITKSEPLKQDETWTSKQKCSMQSQVKDKAAVEDKKPSSPDVYLTIDKKSGLPVIVCSAIEIIKLEF